MYAIAKFGSSCRADIDQHSDQDLLIVCPPSHKKRLLSIYRRQNYSVSFFTRHQLVQMQDKGSLFLQHLRLEAKMMIDLDGELQKFLGGCQFKYPSKGELIRCENALGTILAWPNDSRTDCWKADWLYCVLRDYLVKRLAEQGILAFGITDIVNSSKKLWGVSYDQLYCLKKLRLNKAIFRSKSNSKKVESPLFSEVEELLRIIVINQKSISISYPLDIASLNSVFLNTNYQWLRALEGVYILAHSMGYKHQYHDELLKLVQQPNLYHSSSEVMHTAVKSLFFDIIRATTGIETSLQPVAVPLSCARLHSSG